MLVLAVACTVVGSVATALQPLSSFPASVQSPLVVTGPGADLLSAANTVATIIGVTTIPLIAWSLIQRFRRSSGVECQQYKWFAAAVALAAPPLVVGLALTNASTGVLGTISAAAWDLVFIGLGLIPLAIGVAVLRYRLYEIDRLVSRTISYAVVTAILAAAFAGSILVLQALLAPVTGGQTVAVAGSTLAAFALVSPLLRRVRGLVDRRFDRARYDAERTAAAFADRLRDEVDLAVVSADLARTAAGSLSPASIGLWLRGEEAAR